MFLSEGARQQLETRRRATKQRAAVVVQRWWRRVRRGTGHWRLVMDTLRLHRLDLHQPPPLPPRRSYTVVGGSRVPNICVGQGTGV